MSARIYPSGDSADFQSRIVRHFAVSWGLPARISAYITCRRQRAPFRGSAPGAPVRQPSSFFYPFACITPVVASLDGLAHRRAECISGRQIPLYSRRTATCLRMSVLNSKDATSIAASASKSPKNRRNQSHASARAARRPAEALALLMVSLGLSRLLTSAGAGNC
jgi:hypothetical protein